MAKTIKWRGVLSLIALAGFLFIVGFMACSKENSLKNPVGPSDLADGKTSFQIRSTRTEGGQAGTTLSAEKTAAGFWERTIEYDWTVEKLANVSTKDICSGQSGSVEYLISATRTKVSETDKIGVRGQICVTNGGAVATENLTLVDQVQYKSGSGQFQDLPGASQTIIPSQQLGPGDSECYDYEIEFEPIVGATYRNVAKVTITNHSGWLPGGPHCPGPSPCPFGPEPKAQFDLPGSQSIVENDEGACVSDAPTCPPGFTCTPNDPGPWNFTGSGSAGFTEEIRNVSAQCDQYYDLENSVTLLETDSGQQHDTSALVSIYTCPCLGGCTRTIGYWKNHAGFTGNNLDLVSPLLPIWLGTLDVVPKSVKVTTADQAVGLLSMSGNASNGINKLYAQLLGAKLNIANGADGTAVADTIADADKFLATKNAADWASLSRADRNMVLGWMTTLDNYNNGYIGPGHCD